MLTIFPIRENFRELGLPNSGEEDERNNTMKTTMKFTCAVFAIVTLAIGALPANGAPGDLFASINGAGGNTAGFIYEYTPNGIQNTFAPSLSRPRGVAF